MASVATDPLLSAQVANALARAYLQQNLEFRSKTSGEASDWLTKQVGELRKLVEENEAALQRYRTEHGAEALMTDRLGTEQQNIVVQKLAALQVAETKARTETIERQAQYQQLAAAKANQESLDTVPAIASNSYIQGLKVELALCSVNWHRPPRNSASVTRRLSSCRELFRMPIGSCRQKSPMRRVQLKTITRRRGRASVSWMPIWRGRSWKCRA